LFAPGVAPERPAAPGAPTADLEYALPLANTVAERCDTGPAAGRRREPSCSIPRTITVMAPSGAR
jgi:hypothetical protein